jgi:drug/metabolite transporter (DMT)-like permease
MPETAAMRARTRTAILALVFTVTIWGISPAFVRNLSVNFSPYSSLVVRMVLAGLVFGLVLSFTTGYQIARRDLGRLVILSFTGLLGYYAFTTYGFARVPAGIGTLITASQPMLIALLAWFFGTERLTPWTMLGLAVSFGGTALLVSGSDQGTGLNASDVLLGCLFIFIAGLVWSFFVVLSRPLIQTYGALKITGLSNIIIAIPLALLLTPQMAQNLVELGPRAWTELSILTLLSATTAVVTWNYAAGILRPTLVGMGLYVVPVLAVLSGWFFLNEVITLRVVVSAAIILSGVAFSQMGRLKAARA